MCDPVEIISDVVATATGNPELIPLINAGESTVEGLVSGKGIGQSLESGAISGGEAFAGQALSGAVGFGGGNSFLNDALGTGPDLGLGLPDIGSGISNTLGLGGGGTDAATAGASGGDGATPSVAGATPGSAAPSSAATSSGGIASPLQLGSDSTNALNTQLSQGTIDGASTASPTSLGSVTSSSPVDANALFNTGVTGSGAGATTAPEDFFAGQSPPASPDQFFPGLSSPSVSSVAGAGAASSAAPAAASGASSSLGSRLLPYAIPAAGLAYEAISGPSALPASSKALEQSGAATQPLLDTETKNLNAYNSGQLTPSQLAQITQFTNGAQNQLIQQLASQGVTNPKGDSRYLAGLQQIQEQAQAMQQQFLTATLQAGLSAAGQASNNLSSVANSEINNDNAFQKSLSDAIASLGLIAAGGGKRATA